MLGGNHKHHKKPFFDIKVKRYVVIFVAGLVVGMFLLPTLGFLEEKTAGSDLFNKANEVSNELPQVVGSYIIDKFSEEEGFESSD